MLLRILTCFLFFNAFPTFADDALPTGQQWLDKMNRAMKSLNYQGTVIFMKNGRLDTMKYRHSVENGVEQERLSSLNTPLREVTRKSDEVSCLFKETNEKVVNHHPLDGSFIVNLPQNTETLAAHYSIVAKGNEAIAMLPTQILVMQPKDQYRYPRKIWVETKFFLPLKVEVDTSEGSVLEQVVFTDLQVDGNQDTRKSVTDDNAYHVKHIHSGEAEPFENAPFMLKNWPPGFKTVFFIRNSLQETQKPVDHLLISDGMSSVSVYLEPKEGSGVQGLRKLGATMAFSRVIDNFQVTVLGEVPAVTVENIADGVVLR